MTAIARFRGDRGSATVELAVVAPALLLVLALTIAGGRLALATTSIEQVAAAAARAASIARTAQQAHHAATSTAHRVLAEQRLSCQATSVVVDTSGFARPPGHPAQVHVEVTCVATLSDLALPAMPGTRTLRATFTSPIDPYRGANR